MSNAIMTTSGISAETLEQVIAVGDLSKLTSQQRLEYLANVCKSVGLNPLTRPIRFMNFQGQVVPYATRDCADQLRKIHAISLEVSDKDEVEGLYIVTVRAFDAKGRRDEDMGAVNISTLKGDARANAIMKAITKAKRRATLSICGLGWLDESETDTMPGAVLDIDGDPATTAPEPINTAPPAPKRKWSDVLAEIEIKAGQVQSFDGLDLLQLHEDVLFIRDKAGDPVKARLGQILGDAYNRLVEAHGARPVAQNEEMPV